MQCSRSRHFATGLVLSFSGAGALACTTTSEDAPNSEEKPTITAEGGAPRDAEVTAPEAEAPDATASVEGDSGSDGRSAIDAGNELDGGSTIDASSEQDTGLPDASDGQVRDAAQPQADAGASDALEKNEVLALPSPQKLPSFQQVVTDDDGAHYLLTRPGELGQQVLKYDARWDLEWTSDTILDPNGTPARMGAIAVTRDGRLFAAGLAGSVTDEQVQTVLSRIDQQSVVSVEVQGMAPPQCTDAGENIALGELPNGTLRVHHHLNLLDVSPNGALVSSATAPCGGRNERALAIDPEGNTYYTSASIEHEYSLTKLSLDGDRLPLPGAVIDTEFETANPLLLFMRAGAVWDAEVSNLFLFGSGALYRVEPDGTPVWTKATNEPLALVEGSARFEFHGVDGVPGGNVAVATNQDRVWVAGAGEIHHYPSAGSDPEIWGPGAFISSLDKAGNVQWFRMYENPPEFSVVADSLLPNADGGLDLVWNEEDAGWALTLDERGHSAAPPADGRQR